MFPTTLVLLLACTLNSALGQEICSDGSPFWPDPDCRFYFECNPGNAPVLRKCPEGLYFSVVTRSCTSPDNVQECVGGTRPPITTTPPPTTTGPTTTRGPCKPECCLPDEIEFPSGPLFNDFDPILRIDEGSTYEDLFISGLSTMDFDCFATIVNLGATLGLNVPDYHLRTSFDATGYADFRPFSQGCLPSGNFTGRGEATIRAKNLFYNIKTTIYLNIITNKITIRVWDIQEITFDSVYVDLGPDFFIGDQPVDWSEFNNNFRACFRSELATNKEQIQERLIVAISNRLSKLTFEEFLEIYFFGDCPLCRY